MVILVEVNYPQWHFIGSKFSMIPWIIDKIDFQFSSILDLFGGTGIISHSCRLKHKKIFYNDFLIHLQKSAHGLLNASRNDTISDDLMDSIIEERLTNNNSLFVQYVTGKYFFKDEAVWIDNVYNNIHVEILWKMN